MVKISGAANGASGDQADQHGLTVGSEHSVEFLLELLMVRSVNSAASALGEYVASHASAPPPPPPPSTAPSPPPPPSILDRQFVAMMNGRASELGLKSTRYTNPHGMDPEDTVDECEGNAFHKKDCQHFSTARDLARLAHHALALTGFAALVKKRDMTVGSAEKLNTNKFLRSESSSYYDSRVYGVKTGTTHRAGPCLVSAWKDRRRDVIIVVLGSTDSWYPKDGDPKYFKPLACAVDEEDVCEPDVAKSYVHVCEDRICKLWPGAMYDARYEDTQTLMKLVFGN